METTVLKSNELSLLQQEHHFNLEIMEGVMNGKKQLLVDAENLHQELNIQTPFHKWVGRRLEDNQFVDGMDFWTILSKTSGRPKTQYILTLDSAKIIGMQENVRIRRYFLAVEDLAVKLATTPQLPTDRKQLMALALIEADKTIQEQEEAIKVLAPKAEFYDTVGNAEGFHKVSEVAKILGMGSIRLYEWLRANGFLSSSPAHYNLPYQKLVEQGLFVVKESPYEHPKTGEKRLSFTTLVTGKGLIKLQERLKA